MKLIVFGATGSIGRHLVRQALYQGYSVTAFIRDPTKVDVRHPALPTVRGDVLDPASMERVMPRHDAVYCTLGGGPRGGVRAK
ncbi:NAD(P)-binding oxidoreductase [Thioalkalivibrio nitratireducens]|uniref:NAD(P)-dependent oxidoreductase n=1 Tax=Thioalkalivibrio nitratireducens TaxID=186931 RepID=UPI0009F9AA82